MRLVQCPHRGTRTRRSVLSAVAIAAAAIVVDNFHATDHHSICLHGANGEFRDVQIQRKRINNASDHQREHPEHDRC